MPHPSPVLCRDGTQEIHGLGIHPAQGLVTKSVDNISRFPIKKQSQQEHVKAEQNLFTKH